MSETKYRLVTRSDFDGLVCAVLLRELDLIDDIKFVHPKDMQDGKVEITDRDITTNLPYVPGCHLCFDHHASESMRMMLEQPENHIIDPDAPSAARVVYDHYGGDKRFPTVSKEMMQAVDKADSAQFTPEEILAPTGWVLLNFLMDARTGLGRFKEFRISNYQLMMDLIDHCRTKTINEILQVPDVLERVQLYKEHEEIFRQQLRKCSKVYDNVVVVDLRRQQTIYSGNRFMIYALYPKCNISIHIMWGLKKQNTVFAIGKSIITRTSKTNVGELCLMYNGGGHRAAGTCQIETEQANDTLEVIINKLNRDG